MDVRGEGRMALAIPDLPPGETRSASGLLIATIVWHTCCALGLYAILSMVVRGKGYRPLPLPPNLGTKCCHGAYST